VFWEPFNVDFLETTLTCDIAETLFHNLVYIAIALIKLNSKSILKNGRSRNILCLVPHYY
jgi:hypothetical protein